MEDPKAARIKLQNDLFNAERLRQEKNVGRIEKISVKYKGHPKDLDLVMNKNLSTPYHCAQRELSTSLIITFVECLLPNVYFFIDMYEMLVRRSALALVDGEKLWDMHRPLEDSCELQLLHFQDENPAPVNKAYWRTCSLMLGAVVSSAFKNTIEVILHSFPKPNGISSFFFWLKVSFNDVIHLFVLQFVVVVSYMTLKFHHYLVGRHQQKSFEFYLPKW